MTLDARVVLTGAGGAAAANVVDSLRRSSSRYEIIGVDSDATKLHLSRADHRVVVPLARDERYAASLRAVVDAYGAEVIHVQPDPEVLVVGRHRTELGANTFLPLQDVLETAADKALLARRLDAGGAPVPEAVSFNGPHDVADVCTDLLTRHEKLWVRARVGAGSRAALPVRSAAQAVAWVSWWGEEKGLPADAFMASEYLPGREFAYQSVWQHGELIAGQARERIEYFYGFITPSGQSSTAAVARTVREADVDQAAQRAITALDPRPHGVYCVDMRRDAQGVVRITEINAGRFFTTCNFFAHAGLNMPDMAIRGALGEQLAPVGSSPLEPDLYWIRMVDMGHCLVRGDDLEQWPQAVDLLEGAVAR
jgi:nucleoside-diphosphate-sugar epimerase